ncbi:hypothetical protein LSH36_840g02016 [Paralvinella palmiformis]|uniref:Endoplasmic reticulum-Golgi intermediate compartment protein 1 n=1 Tax=Paralvinella palmiformis TaxID=53620 RepID=A0AAD9MRU4_9ANNE|nr:hypothetical protein LSH36_840g02016 [Paralvinella palmiformis]
MQFDIRRLDIYRKVPKDLTQPTITGACISILSCIFMVFLFYSELVSFITTEIESEMFVEDPMTHSEKIPVKLDIELHKVQCRFIGLDIQDDLGRHEVGFVDNTERIPVDHGLGCRFKSHFKINKVPGNFHISTHASHEQPENPDMTHTIHEVVFGDRVPTAVNLPGSFNPLKGHDKSKANALTSHDYFLKVVPTVYQDITGRQTLHPYQYTYAYRDWIYYGRDGVMRSPAVWFRFDIQPITVKYTERRRPLYGFLTTVCAIVGGTFTVAGIIDSLLFTATEIFKKAELGKLS